MANDTTVSPCCACRHHRSRQHSELPGSHEQKNSGQETRRLAEWPHQCKCFPQGDSQQKNQTKTAAMRESSGGERPAGWRPGGSPVPLQQRAEKTGQNKVLFLLSRSKDQSVFLCFLLHLTEGQLSLSVGSMPPPHSYATPHHTNVRASLEGDYKASRGVSSKINNRFFRLWNWEKIKK